MDCPRLLMVSSSLFNSFSGGGITLTNLFKGWPEERIAAVHTETFPLDRRICSHTYALSPKELGWFWPLNQVFAGMKQKQISSLFRAGVSSQFVERSVLQSATTKREIARRFLRSVIRLIASEGLQDHVTISDALKSWVLDFQPDVIYTLLGSLGYVRLVKELAKLTGAKVAVHMMDDWPSVRYRQGVLAGIFHHQMEIELKQIFQEASVCMGISPAMDDAYQQRYGREFLSYSNALDTTAWMQFARQDWDIRTPLQILYSGSILKEAQLASLLDVCSAVEILNQQGIAAKFVIHTPRPCFDEYQTYFNNFSNCKLKDPLDDAEVANAMALADILALPVNFDLHTRRYVRYSNPTKLPAYMISGTPILAYGPRGVDQIDRAERDGWGYVVENQGVENLVLAIQEIARKLDLRKKIGRRAQEVAQRDHNVGTVRNSFQETLKQAVHM